MSKTIEIELPDGYEFDKETMSIVPIKDNTKYVDLGLPSGTLWANCNVGASNPEEYGDYLTFVDIQKYNCPALDQLEELITECIWVWVKINGINGYLVLGKNENHIFLPAAGYNVRGVQHNNGYYGCYWSTECGSEYVHTSWCLSFKSDYIGYDLNSKYYGQSVRQVKTK